MVWYKVGAMDETPGKSGLAHFLEHLMFKGTKKIAPGDFSKIIARQGGTDNAFTSQDFTAYHQTIASDRLELVMRMEADRMQNLILDDTNVLFERDVVMEERRSRFENDPAAMLSVKVDEALYRNHPYHKPIIGWTQEIEALTTEDALAFYRRHYAPNNAILVVAGDVTTETLRPLAEKIYGNIPPREVHQTFVPEEPAETTARRVTMRSTEVRQPSFLRRYTAPNQKMAMAGEAQAVEVLAAILGNGGTSRLYLELVVKQKLAAGVSVRYDPMARGPAAFSIYAIPTPDVGIEAIEAAIEAELEKLIEKGVTETETTHAINQLQAAATYARDSLDTGAQTIGAALASGYAIEDVEQWPERIGAVTARDVHAAAKRVLRIETSVTGHLLPEEPTTPQSGDTP
ncbi:MAG: insulinase family protein [Alphaproteobacteria bacterium]|nr:insulinase family protein [Alphaproteobacteria bacterium]